jgi:probable HAF family extracellular repeat protein
MKLRTVVFVLTVLAVVCSAVAQDEAARATTAKHHHYKFIDLGTFGGPTSYFSDGFDGILNDQGSSVGWADTSTADPYPAFCFNPDCFVSHAFASRNGVLTDLGALPGGASSQAFWISANGLIAGNSQNGELDPLIPGFPQNRAVLWKNGNIIDLGTLEGGYESLVSALNSRGQVVGLAFNTVPEPFNGLFVTQARAFLWQNGAMQDLGTLGGPDANAALINEAGQVSGSSFTSATPNSTTGIPTQDPFFWQNGKMLDMGTLGGTVGSPSAMNNRGQVVGQSNLAGDLTYHPFIWSKGGGMQDLRTLGGDTGETQWINDAGDVVGKADLPGPAPQNHDPVLWSHGSVIDLGTLPGDACGAALYVNLRGQIVGTTENADLCRIPTGEHAFLWEKGGPMVDLNTLIPAGSTLELTFAVAINGSGEIIGFGVPSGCSAQDVFLCGHAYVLVPCDDGHPGVEGCDYSMVDSANAQSSASATRPLTVAPQTASSPAQTVNSFRNRFTQRYRLPGQRPVPHD